MRNALLKIRFVTLLWLLSSLGAGARPLFGADTVRRPHLVYFRDKANTPYRVEQPAAFLTARAVLRRARQGIAVLPRDLPVDPAYVAAVNAVVGARVRYASRWFNAAVVRCDSATLAVVRALPFVRGARALGRRLPGPPRARPAAGPDDVAPVVPGARTAYGLAYPQNQLLGVPAMHAAGFRGEGLQIAVLDDGFPGVDTLTAFAPLRRENRIGATFNFVDRTRDVYQRDDHGTLTFSLLAANQPGRFIGAAPRATYHLFITEDADSEQPVEEANWLMAAERADSLGADIISSSLGYNTFDSPAADYTYADLDGRTTLITRAATVAARVGMLVVNSAGNAGNQPWRYVLAPADADSILAVGAVDTLLQRAALSSVGPTADGRLKPEVSAVGRQAAVVNPNGVITYGNGTSLAAPSVAGLAAGLWQSRPALTAQQVRAYLEQAGSHADAPDNLTGYGVPTFARAYALANPGVPLPAAGPAPLPGGLALYPNPSPAGADELLLQLPPGLAAQPLMLRIYDVRGALVATVPVPARRPAAVRLRGLAPGVYVGRLQAAAEQYTVRLIKL